MCIRDSGNLSLIDDIEGEAAEDKQFIIVQSKNGNYFYIISVRACTSEAFRERD